MILCTAVQGGGRSRLAHRILSHIPPAGPTLAPPSKKLCVLYCLTRQATIISVQGFVLPQPKPLFMFNVSRGTTGTAVDVILLLYMYSSSRMMLLFVVYLTCLRSHDATTLTIDPRNPSSYPHISAHRYRQQFCQHRIQGSARSLS